MLDSARIDLKKLGERVRFLRTGKGWTLSDLAERSGVSKAYISDLENAAAGKPNIQYVFSIAVALDVTLDELLRDTTSKEHSARKRSSSEDLPPGLKELQMEMGLSDDETVALAQVNFRGSRPKDKEGWRFLLEAIKMVSKRNPAK
jgi:transcriptional regulator with XRE-family HTH domain